MAVVAVGCFDFDAGWCVLGNTLLRQALEWRKHVGASFNGIGWADDVRIGVADVGVGVWIIESGLVWVYGPCCDMDLAEFYIRSRGHTFGITHEVYLLSKTGRIRLQEGVHVLPAVQLSDPTDISVNDRFKAISSPIAED